MTLLRLTILSLLCVFLGYLAASEASPPIGSQFPTQALDGKLGPKGALILVDKPAESHTQEFEETGEAKDRLGLSIAVVRSKIHPGWYVLDRKGAIVAEYFDDTARYTPAAIMVHQFGWLPPEPPRRVEGKQILAQVAASNGTVVPGERIALILDLNLKPGMHVYAPGVSGYIPIDWKMQDSAAVRPHDAMYPKAEKLYLKAIGETVPAYTDEFRLTRDITIGKAQDASGKFVVKGTLRYQACDDRLCYIPQELPLEWSFQYQQSAK